MSRKPTYKDLLERIKTLERKLSETNASDRALKDSQHLLQTLMNTIEGEAFIKDGKGRYQYVNKAFGDDFGVDPQEVIGKDDYFIFPAEAAEQLRKNDQRIMASQKSENVEETGLLKGESVTYMTNKVPLVDEDGFARGICGVGFNITRQKQMEKELKKARFDLENLVKQRTETLTETIEKLRDAEKRYRTVADFTYDWEYWARADGTLIYVSPSCERISGYLPQDFIENPSLLRELILTEDRAIWDEHFCDSREKFLVREIQFQIRHRDGSTRWIEHVCHPVTGADGNLHGIRASNRDITRRKTGEIRLKKAYSEIKALKSQLIADQRYLREEIKQEHNYENILGDSDVMQYVLFRVKQIAETDTTVMIQGETGTGKELIARAIHHNSRRSQRPLIKVDCAALPENLIESELFGHEKGAFTGAVKKRIGRFELANGATLFLDEIGELPLELQKRLLRVLQDGEFERLGSAKVMHTNVRIIAATNRDLEKDIQKGRFRKDLWFRLNVFPLTLPPLRDRLEDIPLIAESILNKCQRRLGKRIKTIPTGVIRQLKTYNWPGNVRELENVIERAVIFTEGSSLRLAEPLKKEMASRAADRNQSPLKSLAEMEKEYILNALNQTQWNISGVGGAAELLRMNASTLRGRMRKHGIRRPNHSF